MPATQTTQHASHEVTNISGSVQDATSLGETLPAIAEVVGGSRAQNELFKQIEEACRKRIVPGASAVTVARAA